MSDESPSIASRPLRSSHASCSRRRRRRAGGNIYGQARGNRVRRALAPPPARLVCARARRGLVAQPLEREERGDVDEHGAAAARRVREQIDALRSGEKSVEVARSVGCAREQGTHHKMDGIPVVRHPKSR